MVNKGVSSTVNSVSNSLKGIGTTATVVGSKIAALGRKIFGIGIAPRLQWRIWIPIHYHGEIVSWTTRSLSDNIKLLNQKNF